MLWPTIVSFTGRFFDARMAVVKLYPYLFGRRIHRAGPFIPPLQDDLLLSHRSGGIKDVSRTSLLTMVASFGATTLAKLHP